MIVNAGKAIRRPGLHDGTSFFNQIAALISADDFRLVFVCKSFFNEYQWIVAVHSSVLQGRTDSVSDGNLGFESRIKEATVVVGKIHAVKLPQKRSRRILLVRAVELVDASNRERVGVKLDANIFPDVADLKQDGDCVGGQRNCVWSYGAVARRATDFQAFGRDGPHFFLKSISLQCEYQVDSAVPIC